MTATPPQLSNIQTALIDQLPDEKFLKPQIDLSARRPIDLPQAVGAALAQPLHFPAISQSVFPGDRVAIALQFGLPHAIEILSMLIAQLANLSIEPEDIVVVINREVAEQFGFSKTQIEAACDPDSQDAPATLPKQIDGRQIHFQIHSPGNSSAVAYLGANEAGDPMYVNRQLVDADVILPVGFPSMGDLQSQTDCLYPAFGSAAVQLRFAETELNETDCLQEIQLANDNLGSFFSIQVVTGPGRIVRQVLSGARNDVVKLAMAETAKLWEFDWPIDSEVTVATIESTVGPPTWDDFTNAVLTASRLSKANGPVIVWSELSARPNRQIRSALLAQFEDEISNKLPRSLQILAAVIQERPVYLRSHLTGNEVEALGIGHINSVTEIQRIAEGWQTGLLIRDAHLCQISATKTNQRA